MKRLESEAETHSGKDSLISIDNLTKTNSNEDLQKPNEPT